MTLSNGIKSAKEIKAPGVTFTSNLKWDKHIDNVIGKSTSIVSKVKFLCRWIDLDSAMKVVTSQFFGTLYNAAPVWLKAELKEIQWNRVNRVIRATVCDFRKKVPRTTSNIISKRATPKQCARYTVAKTVIKLFNQGSTRIGALLRQNSYVNNRNPVKATFFGDTRKEIGRSYLLNKLHIFNDIKFDWIGDNSDDILRQRLKTNLLFFDNCKFQTKFVKSINSTTMLDWCRVRLLKSIVFCIRYMKL